jgi:hypothetical protein
MKTAVRGRSSTSGRAKAAAWRELHLPDLPKLDLPLDGFARESSSGGAKERGLRCGQVQQGISKFNPIFAASREMTLSSLSKFNPEARELFDSGVSNISSTFRDFPSPFPSPAQLNGPFCHYPSLLSTTHMWVPCQGSSSTSLLSLSTRRGAAGDHGRGRWDGLRTTALPLTATSHPYGQPPQLGGDPPCRPPGTSGAWEDDGKQRSSYDSSSHKRSPTSATEVLRLLHGRALAGASELLQLFPWAPWTPATRRHGEGKFCPVALGDRPTAVTPMVIGASLDSDTSR